MFMILKLAAQNASASVLVNVHTCSPFQVSRPLLNKETPGDRETGSESSFLELRGCVLTVSEP
jgi:hypothetical protein